MSKYNPKEAYYSRRNKTQKSGDAKKENHRDRSSQGGCVCNYIITTDNSKGK